MGAAFLTKFGAATLRQSGGSTILAIPKSITQALLVDVGSIVELVVEGRSLSVTPARRRLADRLAASPKSPRSWPRDDDALKNSDVGRELL